MRWFSDRRQAGRELATTLEALAGRDDLVVLALPRGGVPVAFEVALALGAPLDVFTVRKLGAPGNEEYAIGAIASGGVCVVDETAVSALGVSRAALDALIARETRELERREQLYRGGRPFPAVAGHTVIVVDDGLATGTTMRSAVAALKEMRPARIIVAVPVAASGACAAVRQAGAGCVCIATPEPFYGVGLWYEDFAQTSDAEVLELLRRAAERTHAAASPDK